jgi:hypothetical protein
VSELNVGRIESFDPRKKNSKPLHKGYLHVLEQITPDSLAGENVDDEMRKFIERANEAREGDLQFRERRSKKAKKKSAKA